VLPAVLKKSMLLSLADIRQAAGLMSSTRKRHSTCLRPADSRQVARRMSSIRKRLSVPLPLADMLRRAAPRSDRQLREAILRLLPRVPLPQVPLLLKPLPLHLCLFTITTFRRNLVLPDLISQGR
jgi:hypothetical protein